MQPLPPTPPPVIIPGPAPVPGRYTLAQYEALKQVLATGAREVQYGDQRVVYQNPNSIRETLAAMEKELGFNVNRPRRGFPSFGKGLI